MARAPAVATDLLELNGAGEIEFNPHRGQWEAWNSVARFIAVIAGT